MNEKLKEKIKESLSGVLPITVIVLLLSITLVPIENGIILLFLTGALLLIVGMGFFQLGAEMAMTPLGQGVGGGLSKSRNIFVITLICFAVYSFFFLSVRVYRGRLRRGRGYYRTYDRSFYNGGGLQRRCY